LYSIANVILILDTYFITKCAYQQRRYKEHAYCILTRIPHISCNQLHYLYTRLTRYNLLIRYPINSSLCVSNSLYFLSISTYQVYCNIHTNNEVIIERASPNVIRHRRQIGVIAALKWSYSSRNMFRLRRQIGVIAGLRLTGGPYTGHETTSSQRSHQSAHRR